MELNLQIPLFTSYSCWDPICPKDRIYVEKIGVNRKEGERTQNMAKRGKFSIDLPPPYYHYSRIGHTGRGFAWRIGIGIKISIPLAAQH